MNFAIIGCGHITMRHAESLQALPNAELVAVCDTDEERVNKFAHSYGARAYTDYHDMLACSDIDVVTICVPSGLHTAIGQDVARAGKHVLVEKPIALTLEDADALIDTCKLQGVQLGVVLQNRFNPPMVALKKALNEKKLGRLLIGNATVRWYRPQSYYEVGWRGTWSMDGGILLNQAIHHIDALSWLIGDVHSVYAYMDTLNHDIEVPDVCVATIRFKNGAVANIEASTLTYPHNLEGSVAVFGEKGSVKVGGTALNRTEFWKVEGQLEEESQILTNEYENTPESRGYSHQQQIAEMIQAVNENRQPSTSGEEARKSLELVLSIHESARLGQEILIESTMVEQARSVHRMRRLGIGENKLSEESSHSEFAQEEARFMQRKRIPSGLRND